MHKVCTTHQIRNNQVHHTSNQHENVVSDEPLKCSVNYLIVILERT